MRSAVAVPVLAADINGDNFAYSANFNVTCNTFVLFIFLCVFEPLCYAFNLFAGWKSYSELETKKRHPLVGNASCISQ